MKTKHIFVAALDIGEILPFTVKKTKTLAESFKEQERARKELVKFIDALEKVFGERVWYMGFDVIGEKSYERFIFEKGGFFEVLVEPPVALNAHFVQGKRAKRFEKALKQAIRKITKKSALLDMFLDSIKMDTEEGEALKVKSWDDIKLIRNVE